LTQREHRSLFFLLAFAALLRVVTLGVWGPIYQPDSHGFAHIADTLLQDAVWLHDGGLRSGFRAATTFRVLGYPILLAGLKLVFGSAFDIATVVLQSVVSVLAAAVLFRLALAFGLASEAAALAAFGYSSSILWLFDMNILVDSLFANAMFIAAAMPSLALLRGRAPTIAVLAGAGLLLAFATLLRETGVYFAPVWAIGVLVAVLSAGRPWKAAVLAAALILLPTFVTASAYREWNRYRTGFAFLTTAAQATMWFGPIEVAKKQGVAPFAADPRVAGAIQAALDANAETPMQGARAVNLYLYERHGLLSPQIADLAFLAYRQAALAAPVDLMLSRLRRFKPVNALLLTNLTYAPERIIEYSQASYDVPGLSAHLRALRDGRIEIWRIALVVLEVGQRTVSASIFAAFLLGTPWLAYRAFRSRNVNLVRLGVLAWFWLCWGALNGAYLLASFEERYAIATLPLAAVGGLFVLSRRFQRLRAAKNAS
jgi:hypothetical protein